MRMSAEAAEQGTARLQRLQKMKRGNRSSGPVCLLAIHRDHQRRTPISLDDARCSDPNDAAMPAVAINHHAKGIAQNCVVGYTFFNRIHNAAFFFLALAVELVEPLGYFASLGCIFCAEQINDVTSNIHAAGGIDARRNSKCDLARTQRLPTQPRSFEQRL